VTDTISIDQDEIIASVKVSLDITHTYRGDLQVTLLTPWGASVLLQQRNQGGSAITSNEQSTSRTCRPWQPSTAAAPRRLAAFGSGSGTGGCGRTQPLGGGVHNGRDTAGAGRAGRGARHTHPDNDAAGSNVL